MMFGLNSLSEKPSDGVRIKSKFACDKGVSSKRQYLFFILASGLVCGCGLPNALKSPDVQEEQNRPGSDAPLNGYPELTESSAPPQTDSDEYGKVVNVGGPVVSISGGFYHFAVLRNDGTVFTFGSNSDGQLGDGTRVGRSFPMAVVGLPPAKAIHAGVWRTFVTAIDGTVWVFGRDSLAFAGRNGTETTPVQVVGLSDVKTIAHSSETIVALKNDGSVLKFSKNNYDRWMDSSFVGKFEVVSDLRGIKDIAVDENGRIFALAESGLVLTADENNFTFWPFSEEFRTSLIGSKEIAENFLSGTVIIDANNTLVLVNLFRGVRVSNLTDVEYMSEGRPLAVKSDGTVWDISAGLSDRPVDSGIPEAYTAVRVPGLSNVKQVYGSYNQILTLKRDGTLRVFDTQ